MRAACSTGGAGGSPVRACCSTPLLRADARDGERRSHRYYAGHWCLAHVTAALDLAPSSDEVTAIDGFRTAML
ncbi:MAG: hypothetical protein R2713_02360 [Ilumatobacteraceae bacterium]